MQVKIIMGVIDAELGAPYFCYRCHMDALCSYNTLQLPIIPLVPPPVKIFNVVTFHTPSCISPLYDVFVRGWLLEEKSQKTPPSQSTQNRLPSVFCHEVFATFLAEEINSFYFIINTIFL